MLLSSSIVVGRFGSFMISCFIHLYTFSIGFKSGEEGGYIKPRIP